MNPNKPKSIILVGLTIMSLGLVGCKGNIQRDQTNTTTIEDVTNKENKEDKKTENKELKSNIYTPEEFQKEYRSYLEYLFVLSAEVPLDTYAIIGFNYTQDETLEFKRNNLLSFEKTSEFVDFMKSCKVPEIKTLSKHLIKEIEFAQDQLIEIGNDSEIRNNVSFIKPIIEELVQNLKSNVAKKEEEILVPLLEKNGASEIKKEIKSIKETVYKESKERNTVKLQKYYGEKTKKLMKDIYKPIL